MKRSILRAGVVLSALLLVATGCGKSDSSSTSSSGSGTLAAVKANGHLTVGSDIAYAPVEFYKSDGKTAQGIDVDLCNAIAKAMTLSGGCQFVNTTFDGIIPALTAKRFDIIMSAMSDTKERQQQIDFVDYFTVGTSIIVKKGNPQNITSLDDLCGKTVGLQKGTTQEDVANNQATRCNDQNKGKLTILTFDTDTDAQTALKGNRSVADMNDFPVAAYAAQTAGGGNDFEVVGDQIAAGPYGIGVRKADTSLRNAIRLALAKIISDGTYKEVLQKWNVTQGGVVAAKINGGK